MTNPDHPITPTWPGLVRILFLALFLIPAAAGPALCQWCSCDLEGWSGPLIFDRDYNPKPAYTALSRELGGVGDTNRGLRSLAPARLGIGTAMRYQAAIEGGRYMATLLPQFNQVTPESALKFGEVHPHGLAWDPAGQTGYDFSRADQLIGLAAANSLQVRGHTLVWHGFLPDWVMGASRDQITPIFTNHILRVVGRFRDRKGGDGQKTVVAWDVVNEAVNNDGELRLHDEFWGKFGGAEGEPAKLEFIREMFETAHRADPEARLFLNDFDCFTNQAKLDKVLALAAWLRDNGAPIHGVGFQTHLTATDLGIGAKVGEVARTLEAMGLEMQITEMDVRFQDCQGSEETQAQVYGEVLRACLMAGNCTSFTMWGFTDNITWFEGCD